MLAEFSPRPVGLQQTLHLDLVQAKPSICSSKQLS